MGETMNQPFKNHNGWIPTPDIKVRVSTSFILFMYAIDCSCCNYVYELERKDESTAQKSERLDSDSRYQSESKYIIYTINVCY
jgi:hypothetical protein